MSVKPVLIVMAAGMGSRFGGLKQIAPITPYGDLIIDFSIHDAVKAGFETVIFIIKRELEDLFREKISKRIETKIKVLFAYQDLEDLPEGFSAPDGRIKPYGTGHAVLACRHLINSPFVVINADDYYGSQAFSMIFKYLINNPKPYNYAMVSYRLDRTVTEHGHVARGVCDVNNDSFLQGISEKTRIEQKSGQISYTDNDGKSWHKLAHDTQVSMNFWGFQADMMKELEAGFPEFIKNDLLVNPLKAEYYLPGAVDMLLKSKKATVKVLASPDSWFGVTYKEDTEKVAKSLTALVDNGQYPDLVRSN